MIVSRLLTIFTSWASAYFVFRYSVILIISALYVTSIHNTPLHPSFLFTYIPSIPVLGLCILYIVDFFLVFLSIFLIYSNLQLTISNLYLNTGTAKAATAVILFLAFISDFSIILHLLGYSCFTPSVICWCCMPSFSLIPR